MNKIVFLACYVFFILQVVSCNGFKSTGSVPPVENNPGGPQTTPGPTTTPRVTPTPSVVPTPTPLPSATPPGGDINCPNLGGRFSSGQQIINYVNDRGDSSSCIRLNDQVIRTGFAPCITCIQDGWTPTPTPTPAVTPTPWPSATPTPGGGSGGT
jgi:hypothetical protein